MLSNPTISGGDVTIRWRWHHILWHHNSHHFVGLYF